MEKDLKKIAMKEMEKINYSFESRRNLTIRNLKLTDNLFFYNVQFEGNTEFVNQLEMIKDLEIWYKTKEGKILNAYNQEVECFCEDRVDSRVMGWSGSLIDYLETELKSVLMVNGLNEEKAECISVKIAWKICENPNMLDLVLNDLFSYYEVKPLYDLLIQMDLKDGSKATNKQVIKQNGLEAIREINAYYGTHSNLCIQYYEWKGDLVDFYIEKIISEFINQGIFNKVIKVARWKIRNLVRDNCKDFQIDGDLFENNKIRELYDDFIIVSKNLKF